jgi:hypothetical protein
LPLAHDLNMDLFYSSDAKGYTDYPFVLPEAPLVQQVY